MLVDTDSLWFSVLSARYGVEGVCVWEGGRDAFVWWRDISALHEWRSGFMVMLVSLWEMVRTFFFGQMSGWGDVI